MRAGRAGGYRPSAITGIVLAVGQSSNNNQFAEMPGGSIAGRVYTGTDDLGGTVSLSATTATGVATTVEAADTQITYTVTVANKVGLHRRCAERGDDAASRD